METMDIQLRRAMEPGEMVKTSCALCGLAFEVETIVANVLYPGGEWGAACPTCVEFYGQRNPERFPSLEEYEEAKRRYTEPVYSSAEEVMRLEQADDPSVHEAYRASWLSRA
jgi:hypothetical protein